MFLMLTGKFEPSEVDNYASYHEGHVIKVWSCSDDHHEMFAVIESYGREHQVQWNRNHRSARLLNERGFPIESWCMVEQPHRAKTKIGG